MPGGKQLLAQVDVVFRRWHVAGVLAVLLPCSIATVKARQNKPVHRRARRRQCQAGTRTVWGTRLERGKGRSAVVGKNRQGCR